jgi:hypothetical protein
MGERRVRGMKAACIVPPRIFVEPGTQAHSAHNPAGAVGATAASGPEWTRSRQNHTGAESGNVADLG